MLIKVIRDDGTSGIVRSTSLGELVKSGKVVAYQCSEGWIESRRKPRKGKADEYTGVERRKIGYQGPERRVS